MVRVLHNDFIGRPAPDAAQGKAVHLVRDAGVDLQPGQRGLDAQDILAHIHKGPGRRAGQPAVFRLAEGGGVAASHHLAVDIRLGAVDLADVLNVSRADLAVQIKCAVSVADNGLSDGDPWVVLDFQHVKPGKGAAFVRVKMKNIIDGGVVETTFRPTETFEQAHIERKKMQYLYNDGEFYNYMDNETFEQIMISAEDAADSMKFVKENEEVTISFYQGNAFAIDPPLSVELVVTETEPGVKGNTATGATKPAIVETGAKVNVPLFVDQGETIKIDTRTGAYLSRA